MDKNDGKFYIDLGWDDNHVVPEIVTPEVEFIFRRMTEVAIFESALQPGEVVLDVGCGRALDCVLMSESGAQVIGLEPSRVMLRHACDHVKRSGARVMLVRGIGEDLPFRSASVDKVICKGAIDHFADPVRVLEEIARVLRADGKMVVAVANFGSLGFKLGRAVYRLWRRSGRKNHNLKMPWEVPADHTTRFDYVLLKRMLDQRFRVCKIIGVSLLFGVPWWGAFLARCPREVSRTILALLDKAARYFPRLGDVLVATCMPRVSQ